MKLMVWNKVQYMKKNNKGFSLVELIVTFAIVAIIGVAVYGFMSVSNRQFMNTTSDVGLQYDQQIVVNQIRDYILESSNSIYYDDVDQSLYVFKQTDESIAGVAPDPGVPGDLGTPGVNYSYLVSKIHFVNPNGTLAEGDEGFNPALTDNITVKSFYVEEGAADAYIASHADDDETNDGTINDLYKDSLSTSDGEKILGSNVQSLVYDFSEFDNDKVAFDIVFYKDGKEFKSHQVVSLRNNVTLSDSEFVVDTTLSTVTSSIESISIYRMGYDEVLNTLPAGSEALHIGKYGVDDVNIMLDAKVSANVASKYNYNFGVTWVVYDESGNKLTYENDGIGISEVVNNNSTLKINGSIATNTVIKVVAISKDDANKTASVNFTVDDVGAYPDTANLYGSMDDYNGYRMFTFVPTVNYTSALSGVGTNILSGDQLLTGSMRIEWEIDGELPETANGIKSELDEQKGLLSISKLAEGRSIRVRFKVKELKADGSVLYSNWYTLNTTDIPEYVSPETLKLSVPDESTRGDTTVATVSWLTNPKEKIKYYWKIVDDVDNTTSSWYDVSVGAIATNFDKVVTLSESDNGSSYFLKAGSIGGVYGEFSDGISGSDWYESSESNRFAQINIQSYLYWKRAYKIKVMCFAVGYADDGVTAKVVYDASGRHEISEGKPIVPVVGTTKVPKVQFIVTASDSFKSIGGYKTTDIIRQNVKAPGEQRAFDYRVVGLNMYADANGNSSITSDGKSLNTHYIFYNSAGNKVNLNKYRGNTGYVVLGESRVDKEELYDAGLEFMFELDIVKKNRDTGKNTDFFTYNPQKMTFYMTLNQNIEIDGVNVVNSIDSNEFKYKLMYSNN